MKTPGSIGGDIKTSPAVNVVCDLNSKFLPFKDGIFDKIVAKQILEHIDNIEDLLLEIHRVSKPGTKLIIEVPHFSSYLAYGDPTHKHFLSYFSFDKIVEVIGFKSLDKRITFHRAFRRYQLHRVFNKFPRGYERFWAFICPAEHLHFEMEVVK